MPWRRSGPSATASRSRRTIIIGLSNPVPHFFQLSPQGEIVDCSPTPEDQCPLASIHVGYRGGVTATSNPHNYTGDLRLIRVPLGVSNLGHERPSRLSAGMKQREQVAPQSANSQPWTPQAQQFRSQGFFA